MSDLELPSFYKKETRKARKEYRCFECKRKITVGETHGYAFGIYEGDPREHRFCDVCEWLRETLDIDEEEDGFGELWFRNVDGIEPKMIRAKLFRDVGWSWRELDQHFGISHVIIREWVKKVEEFKRKHKGKNP
jgi:hypothetical protein